MSRHSDHSPDSRKQHELLRLLEQNRLAEAKGLLADLCRREKNNAQLWLMLGAVNQQLGDVDAAAAAYLNAIAARPELATGHYHLGTLRLETGKVEEAAESFRRAVACQPDFLEALGNLGSALEQMERHADALDCYRHALRLDPGIPELHYNMGNVLQTLGRHAEAEQSYREAIRLRPAYVEAHDHLGVAAAKQDRHDEAIAHYRRALAIRPDHAASHYNLAMSLKHLDRWDEAVANYRRALAINPRDTDAHVNLGVVLVKQKKFDEAVAHYRESLRLKPDDAGAYNNLGMAFVERQKFDEAAAYYNEALRLKPDDADTHFNLSLLLLLRGDFRNGWNEYHWRWRREGKPPRPFPPSSWEGGDLDGRNVFLHAEQGLGDEMFFLRFAPWLKQRGAGRVTYRPTPKLASLLSRARPIDRVAGPDETPGADDLVFSVGDLPRLFGMERTDQIPSALSLTPVPEKLEQVRARLAAFGPPPYLGVTWRAGVKGEARGLYKEVRLEALAQTLCNVPGTVLALQRLPAEGEIETFRKRLGRPAHDFSALNDDLEAMLALLALIDDYIGVSNTNMHLRAGAGKTARVLVPSPPEWRWMAAGKESPWFPGFTIYRQGHDGSWESALAALRQNLIEAFAV